MPKNPFSGNNDIASRYFSALSYHGYRAIWTANRLEAGQVYVNGWYTGGVETPFGGMKESGIGREKGQEAIYNYVQSKYVGILSVSDPS